MGAHETRKRISRLSRAREHAFLMLATSLMVCVNFAVDGDEGCLGCGFETAGVVAEETRGFEG